MANYKFAKEDVFDIAFWGLACLLQVAFIVINFMQQDWLWLGVAALVLVIFAAMGWLTIKINHFKREVHREAEEAWEKTRQDTLATLKLAQKRYDAFRALLAQQPSAELVLWHKDGTAEIGGVAYKRVTDPEPKEKLGDKAEG